MKKVLRRELDNAHCCTLTNFPSTDQNKQMHYEQMHSNIWTDRSWSTTHTSMEKNLLLAYWALNSYSWETTAWFWTHSTGLTRNIKLQKSLVLPHSKSQFPAAPPSALRPSTNKFDPLLKPQAISLGVQQLNGSCQRDACGTSLITIITIKVLRSKEILNLHEKSLLCTVHHCASLCNIILLLNIHSRSRPQPTSRQEARSLCRWAIDSTSFDDLKQNWPTGHGFFNGDILDDMYIKLYKYQLCYKGSNMGVIWGIYEDMIYSILFILPHNWAPKWIDPILSHGF